MKDQGHIRLCCAMQESVNLVAGIIAVAFTSATSAAVFFADYLGIPVMFRDHGVLWDAKIPMKWGGALLAIIFLAFLPRCVSRFVRSWRVVMAHKQKRRQEPKHG
jgi:hypothetical protein